MSDLEERTVPDEPVVELLPADIFDVELLLQLSDELLAKARAFKATIIGGTAGQWGAVNCIEAATYDIHGAAGYLWKDQQQTRAQPGTEGTE